MAAHFVVSSILRESFSDLVSAIELHDPASVATELFANGVIPDSIFKAATQLQSSTPAKDKAVSIMTCCLDAVKLDSSKFRKFLLSLKKCTVAPNIIYRVRKMYCEL